MLPNQETEPVELEFVIDDHVAGPPVIEISARGEAIARRAHESGSPRLAHIGPKDYVLLGTLEKNGTMFEEWTLELGIDGDWVKSVVPEATKQAAWGTRMSNHSVDLDDFYAAYVEAALWSSTDESTPSGGYPLDQNYGPGDFTRDAQKKMRHDTDAFAHAHAALIAGRERQAGHDFWLTRNGHGAGFWDGDWPEPAASVLTAASKEFGEQHVSVYRKRLHVESYLDNPNRPPKQWWKDCTRGVAVKSPGAQPESVCGSLWHHKMSEADKRRIVRESEGRLDNPGGGIGWIVGGLALALGAGYLLTRKSSAAASTCTIDIQKLNKWAVGKQLIGMYLPTITKPLTLAELKASSMGKVVNWDVGYPVVLVINQGDFYRYDASGNPVPAPEWKADYCAS